MSEVSPDFGVAMTKLTDLEIQWYVEQSTPWVYFVKLNIH
jgi:hypothetical protein